MKIFKRVFVAPIKIHRTNTGYTDRPNICVRWDKSKIGGTMRYTSYTLQIITKNKEFQWSFVWRPDVTRHWWKDSIEHIHKDRKERLKCKEIQEKTSI